MRALLLLAALAGAPAAAQEGVAGAWMVRDNGGVVVLRPCGASLCGVVEGITGFQRDGSAPVDWLGRSRCHMLIVPDLQQEEPGAWFGHITNPDDGKTYTIRVTLDGAGRLQMRGYIGIPLLGRTTVWTRFNGRLTPDCHVEPG